MNRLACGWLRLACAASLAVTAAGCVAPITSSYLSGSRRQEAEASTENKAEKTPDPNSPKAAALRKATGQQPSNPEAALAGVLDELQTIGAIDPRAQQELMAELKRAKPEHYELIVENFQAALSYKQQLAQRKLDEASQLATDQPDEAVELAAHHSAASDAAGPRRVAAHKAATPAKRSAPVAPATSEQPAESPTARSNELTRAAFVEVAEPAGGDWRAQLNGAIDELASSVNPQPGTVAELHEHMRLRTLELLAGREEDAYRPIPGSSAAQQDFWSKQLFAMNAYLNGAEDQDDKQRAAGTLLHLDEARAALAELATLQIRNPAFVKSVDGFGVYEPLTATQFKPGEQVALYAEVENFRSESTEEGYRTALGTSYQVVDKSGRRVEGGQFPEITDSCRSRRRDFHMQYGVALPKRIYPGPYELVLVITDQQSGKIGRASLPFEIVAER